MNSNKLFVVDNFYKNPDTIRNFAISSNDYLKEGYNYESQKLYFNENIIRDFEKIIGEKIFVDPKRFGFGTLTYFAEGDETHNYTHYDSNGWVGIVYLVPDETINGDGLTICKHKDSGLTGPPDQNWLNENNYHSIEQWKSEVYTRDQTNHKAWETTAFIGMKYNRLILKKAGTMFHRGTKSFGDNPGNSKLMHRFFFETMK